MKSCFAHSIKGYCPLLQVHGVLIPSLCINNSRTLTFKIPRPSLVATPRVFFMKRCTFVFRLALPPKGRLRQLTTPLRTIKELGHSLSMQCFYHDFSFIYDLFPLLSFVLSIFVYNLCYVVVFGVCLSIDYIHSFSCLEFSSTKTKKKTKKE